MAPTKTRTRTAAPAATQRYVLLPMRGLRSEQMLELGQNTASFRSAASARAPAGGQREAASRASLRIVDSVHADGPKLAEMTPTEVLALRVSDPGVKAVPVVYYHVNRRPEYRVEARVKPTAAAPTVIKVKVVDAATHKPVQGANVVAFTDFAQRLGAGGTSSAAGTVSLKLGAATKQIEVLIVYGPSGYWGLLQRGIKLKTGAVLPLPAIDLTVPDYAAALYGDKPWSAGTGVSVGVIDTGVDLQHPDLHVTGGAAFVIDEKDAGGYGPAAKEGEHGSHVAGIIASRGRAPTGKRGIAPAVNLYSYRVFPNAGGGAANYDIVRAIDRGVADGCDLLNLSLGGRDPDPAVHEAIKDAFDKGTLCIIASGNDERQPVSYPARWPEAIAVGAAGRIGTFPDTSTENLDAVAPFSPADAKVFVAGFSNIGPEVDLIGPGVGIVSTVPVGQYAVLSGTSMACPAATGATAALLGEHPEITSMPRNRQRALAIQALINQSARTLKFDRNYEGLGLLP